MIFVFENQILAFFNRLVQTLFTKCRMVFIKYVDFWIKSNLSLYPPPLKFDNPYYHKQ